jgi:2-enoate reductase
VLEKPELVEKSRKIVVIGGGVVGCETAFYLNKELGKEVTVISWKHIFMNHVCTANRAYLIHYMEKAGVKLLNCTKTCKYEIGGIKVS